MIMGFFAYKNEQTESVELCIQASHPDILSKPLRVDFIQPSDAAVYFLSPSEAVVASWSEQEQAKIIRTVLPSCVYLTPDTSDRPGEKATKLKIIEIGERQYEIHYARSNADSWMKWDPNLSVR